jgi:hypothetical protein
MRAGASPFSQPTQIPDRRVGDRPTSTSRCSAFDIEGDRATVWMLTNDRYQAYTVDCFREGDVSELGIGGRGLDESAPPEVAQGGRIAARLCRGCPT